MQNLIYAVITLLGWGTWLAPSQKVVFPNQQIRNLFVVVTNLVIATVVSVLHGGVWELTPGAFWLTFFGGVIWAVGGLFAFTGTSRLGMGKALGIWAPLNIVVSLVWGAILFDEFVSLTPETLLLSSVAIITIIGGVLLIIFAKGTGGEEQEQGAYQLGLAGAIGAGILWGSYFIPVKYSGVSLWAGAFPLALGMTVGGGILALLARQSWRLQTSSDYILACLSGVLWSVGNYGMLLLVSAIGAGKGFTISQTAVVIGALISIYWLNDPPPKTRAARLTFIGCVLATSGGIVLGNLK